MKEYYVIAFIDEQIHLYYEDDERQTKVKRFNTFDEANDFLSELDEREFYRFVVKASDETLKQYEKEVEVSN